MYNIKLCDYVPEPRPVKGDYVVCAHYYAAWKKGAAEIHGGFDDLHTYPERTPLAGYYDEENPSYTDWEIKWAAEHGVNCFIHCWYRYKDNVGNKVTEKNLRCGHGLHSALFNAKYEKLMKFAIMFETSPRWGATTPTDMLENLMPFWMETYFKRGNYLIIDNKPVLFNFMWSELAKCFSSPEEQKAIFDKCREYCKVYGFDGMIFAAQEKENKKELRDEILARGYDFAFSYNWEYQGEDNPSEEKLIEEQYKYYSERIATDANYIPTASCFWDSEPRTTKHWMELGYRFDLFKTWYISPDGFRKVLRNCKKLCDSLPSSNVGRRIIMLDNWNEWDEGHFISPSHKFGFRYLQAIREELTERDNLPDYRMPQDIGLSNFNKNWGEPDLRKECQKKFGVK